MESSRRDVFIDMVVKKFILEKKNALPLFQFHSQNKVWDYLKHGLVFTVWAVDEKPFPPKERIREQFIRICSRVEWIWNRKPFLKWSPLQEAFRRTTEGRLSSQRRSSRSTVSADCYGQPAQPLLSIRRVSSRSLFTEKGRKCYSFLTDPTQQEKKKDWASRRSGQLEIYNNTEACVCIDIWTMLYYGMI